jgi:hypothetical protein
LIYVKPVFIDSRARAAIPTVDKSTIKLNEGSEVRTKMQVGTREISLHKVAVVGWLGPESWMILIFTALSYLTVQR